VPLSATYQSVVICHRTDGKVTADPMKVTMTDYILDQYQINTDIEHLTTFTFLPLPKIGRICPIVWASLAFLCTRPIRYFAACRLCNEFIFVLDTVYKFSCLLAHVAV